MRTSIEIDDDLLNDAKKISLDTKRSLGKVIEDALRVMIARKNAPIKPEVSLFTVKGNGLNHGVDIDDSQSLADIMDH